MRQSDLSRAFRRRGGILTTGEVLAMGVHPRELYTMRDAGLVEELVRGLYHLNSEPLPNHFDLIVVSRRVPNAVICTISALDFHGITTRIPHRVHILLPRGTRTPRISIPPLRVYRCIDRFFDVGIETHQVDGTELKVTSIERTIVDCFRRGNRIELEVALEALNIGCHNRQINVDKLMELSKLLRCEKRIRPYVEATLYKT